MMSRASLLSGNQIRNALALAVRATATTPASSAAATDSGACSTSSRPVRQEPGKVRLGFVPEEWFTFFYKKTGVTGPYTLGITLTTYLMSKEIYVMEHEYYSGLSLLLMCVMGVKYMGPAVAKWLDKEIDEYEAGWNQGRKDQKDGLEEMIQDEERLQWSSEGQNMLIQAKRENVALQLEAAYRQRVQTAYQEVKKRLDYQVEIQNIEKRIAQKNLIDFVVSKVKSSITPDQEKQNIDKCISDLGGLAKA
ncbi:ATP synthase subunit b, mitochondrial [Onthophagus taurus]|uniref:ATP synthase subunit b, mitochondrial n=1 Tax=Onthophagus taurus TaxID=166361 RepID=UPI000C1FEF44|nr:ATP synthase subunit b, mitochondrial [Onthophagus taurus]